MSDITKKSSRRCWGVMWCEWWLGGCLHLVHSERNYCITQQRRNDVNEWTIMPILERTKNDFMLKRSSYTLAHFSDWYKSLLHFSWTFQMEIYHFIQICCWNASIYGELYSLALKVNTVPPENVQQTPTEIIRLEKQIFPFKWLYFDLTDSSPFDSQLQKRRYKR